MPAPSPHSDELIRRFQGDASEIETRPVPFAARMTAQILAALVVCLLVWGSIGTLDKVVVTRAALETRGSRIVVQPLQTAVIKQIHVEPGQPVTAGQPLVTLDNTFAQADMEQLRNRAQALDLQLARLTAERDHTPFNPPMTGPAAAYAVLQKATFEERNAQREARIRGYDERLAQIRSTVSGLQREVAILEDHVKVVGEVEKMRKQLFDEDRGSRLNYLAARSGRLEIEADLAESAARLRDLAHEQESVAAEKQTFLTSWQGSISEDLTKARLERDTLGDQISKAERIADMIVLTSPADAVVLDIAQRSVGSVVQEAEALVRLVPRDAELEFVAYINAADVGAITTGAEVTIKLDAFTYTEHGTLTGTIRSISSDTFTGREAPPPGTDPATQPLGATYYKARLTVTRDGMTGLPKHFQLLPGMTASAEIKVGERTVLSYLFQPLTKAFSEGMREP